MPRWLGLASLRGGQPLTTPFVGPPPGAWPQTGLSWGFRVTKASLPASSAWPCAVPPAQPMSTRGRAEASWACCRENGLSLSQVGPFQSSGILVGLAGWAGAAVSHAKRSAGRPSAEPAGRGRVSRQPRCIWADKGVSPPRLPWPIPPCPGLTRQREGGSCLERPPSHFLLAACPHGRFGPHCAHVCSCGQGAACDPVTGTCSCPPGRTGVHCEHGESLLPLLPGILHGYHSLSLAGRVMG